MRLHWQCSCRDMCAWLSDRTTHTHFHLSASISLCVPPYAGMYVHVYVCLSHRAIIQLQTQLQVSRSVISDKLC